MWLKYLHLFINRKSCFKIRPIQNIRIILAANTSSTSAGFMVFISLDTSAQLSYVNHFQVEIHLNALHSKQTWIWQKGNMKH